MNSVPVSVLSLLTLTLGLPPSSGFSFFALFRNTRMPSAPSAPSAFAPKVGSPFFFSIHIALSSDPVTVLSILPNGTWRSFPLRFISATQLPVPYRYVNRKLMQPILASPSLPARTLGSCVRIPLKAWIFVCVYSVFV
jgi:hypothetical protein